MIINRRPGNGDNGPVNGDDDEPVHCEEEMVDADGDRIPLRGMEAARTKSFTCFQPNHDHNPSLHRVLNLSG